jgi:Holliday junction DNA helicase RuvA
MIAKLTGKLTHKSVDYLILDVNGVGYQLYVPLSTFYRLPEPMDTVSLYTYLHVREDALVLYGFHLVDEKNIFLKLISISGIGPRLAISILSGISVCDLIEAVELQDVKKLTAIPGVGNKTAQRIALELKDKIRHLEYTKEVKTIGIGYEDIKMREDVISALVNLGYKKNAAEKALEIALKEHKEEKSLEELLKITLKVLSKG